MIRLSGRADLSSDTVWHRSTNILHSFFRGGRMESFPKSPTSTGERDFTVAEYDALRAEMLSNAQIVAQVFTVTITGVAALIGFGVQTSNVYLFLVPPLFLLPSLLFIASQLEALLRIAAYIQVFIEQDKPGMHWETALTRQRLKQDRSRTSYIFSVIGIYFILILICLTLPWFFVHDFSLPTDIAGASRSVSVQIVVASAFILLATLVAVLRTSGSYSGARLKNYQQEWSRIREQWLAEQTPKS
jgi:hypothetical protein